MLIFLRCGGDGSRTRKQDIDSPIPSLPNRQGPGYNPLFKMRFFFTASVHGKKQLESNYRLIEQEVKRLGHEVDNGNFSDQSPEEMDKWDEHQSLEFHKKIMNGMKRAEGLLIEASYPSVGVGFNLASAVQLAKPIIVFFTGKEEPHIFRTLEKINDKFQVVRYANLDQLRKEIPPALAFATENQDTRFNFFISPEHAKYLDWIAQTYKMSRSVYLRRLINREMDKLAEEFSMSDLM